MVMSRWIPRKVMQDILKAINASDGSTCVFYLTGEAGVGKTVLLRQIGRLLDSADGIQPHFPWSGILDLYHSDVNSNSGLEQGLMDALEVAGEFRDYQDARAQFTAHREAGIREEELEEERKQLIEVFARCLNKVAKDHRLVIALDTTERIQYGLDPVQELCGLEGESSTVKPWLLAQLPRWQNCVVLIAGRPDPSLAAALTQCQNNNNAYSYMDIKLTGFDAVEMQAYLADREQDVPELSALTSDDRNLLAEVTEGRPIRVELALEVLRYGLGFDRFWEKIKSLPANQAQAEIDHWLTDPLMNDPQYELRDIIQYLAVSRKGLSPELLHHLTGWRIETCRQKLEVIADRTFIKTRPDDGRFFLHDEMYDFCDAYLQHDRMANLSGRIVEWYDQQIKRCDEKMKTAVTDQERRDTRQAKQNYQVDSLLYRLRVNPREGYEWYTREAEYAIRSAEVGYDMRLRNELLAFLNSKSPVDRRILADDAKLRQEIDCDAVAHWVKRYMMRGQSQEAARIAARVSEAPEFRCLVEGPGYYLARADLAVYHAQALIYAHRAQEGIDLLKATIQQLEKGQSPEVLAVQERDTFAGWRRNLILGRAHNNLGYAYWMVLQRYALALDEFRKALPYFRASDLLEETANTTDNMGRVYATLYRRSRAESLIADGLELRRQLGLEYRVALSLISQATFHLAFGEPHRAQAVARQALDICESLETPRGIGLASLVMGRALRQLGSLWVVGVYGYEECKKHLADARRYIERARDIFEKKVTEPVRLIEAYNELGCIYREWAILEKDHDPASPLPRALFTSARKQLDEGLAEAEKWQSWVQYIDSCEDIAQTYFQQGDLDSAALWLNRAEDKVPALYKIVQGQGLPDVSIQERVEEYWQLMGKVELLRGHLEYERGISEGLGKILPPTVERMTQHYAFAAAYFERHSGHAIRLESTFKQVHSRFKRCKIEDIRYVQEHLLPSLKEAYKLSPEALSQFFEDTLGMAAIH